MLDASIAPSAPPAPMIVCISSINSIMLGFDSNSFIILDSFSSNSPRYLVPAITLNRFKLIIILFFNVFGTSPKVILLASSSTIAVLPTPASPINIGLFLFFLSNISIILSISRSLPITLSNSLFLALLLRFMPSSLSMSGVVYFCSLLRLLIMLSRLIFILYRILYPLDFLFFSILLNSSGKVISSIIMSSSIIMFSNIFSISLLYRIVSLFDVPSFISFFIVSYVILLFISKSLSVFLVLVRLSNKCEESTYSSLFLSASNSLLFSMLFTSSLYLIINTSIYSMLYWCVL